MGQHPHWPQALGFGAARQVAAGGQFGRRPRGQRRSGPHFAPPHRPGSWGRALCTSVHPQPTRRQALVGPVQVLRRNPGRDPPRQPHQAAGDRSGTGAQALARGAQRRARGPRAGLAIGQQLQPPRRAPGPGVVQGEHRRRVKTQRAADELQMVNMDHIGAEAGADRRRRRPSPGPTRDPPGAGPAGSARAGDAGLLGGCRPGGPGRGWRPAVQLVPPPARNRGHRGGVLLGAAVSRGGKPWTTCRIRMGQGYPSRAGLAPGPRPTTGPRRSEWTGAPRALSCGVCPPPPPLRNPRPPRSSSSMTRSTCGTSSA